MVRRALVTAGVLLAILHVWLLVGQVWDGQLADLGLAARWLVAAGLVGALIRLKRRGVSLFIGRQAAAVWLLAVLLHAPAAADRFGVPGVPAVPEVVATLSQMVASAAAFVGLVFLLGFLLVKRHGTRRPAVRTSAACVRVGSLAFGTHLLFAPRPPPLG